MEKSTHIRKNHMGLFSNKLITVHLKHLPVARYQNRNDQENESSKYVIKVAGHSAL